MAYENHTEFNSSSVAYKDFDMWKSYTEIFHQIMEYTRITEENGSNNGEMMMYKTAHKRALQICLAFGHKTM